MQVEIENFFPSNHKTIKATFDICIKDWGKTKIRKLKLLETKGEKWFAFPSMWIKREGETGYWLPLVSIEGEQKEELQKSILKALESSISALDNSQAELSEIIDSSA